jgi:Leucine-rich repeat (LRR) protein
MEVVLAHDIFSQDLATALAGADQILKANGDGAYLADIRYGRSNRYIYELQQEGHLKCDEATFRVRQLAFLKLIARGSSPKAQKLRTEVVSLHILGSNARWVWGNQPRFAIDLTMLEGLPLRSLSLQHGTDVLWPTTGFPLLESLSLSDTVVPTLPAAPALTSLQLNGTGLVRVELGGYPKLETLVLNETGLSHVGGLPAVQTLTVHRGQSLSLRAQPGLKRLAWNGTVGSLALDDASSLVHADIRDPADLSMLAGADALQSLQLRDGSITDLDGLPTTSLTSLEISGCKQLADVSALGGAPKLQTLQLRSLDALQQFTGFDRGLPELTQFNAYRCALHSLKGLGYAPKLSSVNAQNCVKLAKVSGLGDCKQLRQATFRHCGKEVGLNLLGLEGAPLTHLSLTGSRVGKTRIPEALWPVVRPPSMVKKAGKRKASDKPKPTAAKGATARSQASRLKKLIMSRDLDRIDQAAELVGILGEEVACAISDGCTIQRDAPLKDSLPKSVRAHYRPLLFEPTWDRLVPNSLLDHGDLLLPYRGHAMRVLASAGGAPSLADVRSLLMVGRTKVRRGQVPVRLDPILGLEKLERVGVYECSELQGTHALEGLQRFCGYSLGGVELVSQVAGPLDIALEGYGVLKGLGDTDALRNLERLEVSAYRFSAVATEFARLRRLKALTLHRGVNVDDAFMEALAHLPLESIEFSQHQIQRVETLLRPGLKHLGLLVRGTPDSLDCLQGAGLESMTLYNGQHQLSWLPEGLRTLTMRNGKGFKARDVACKETVETLRLINVRDAYGLDELLKWPKLKRLVCTSRVNPSKAVREAIEVLEQ